MANNAGMGRNHDAGSAAALREGMEWPGHSEAHMEAIRENGQGTPSQRLTK